MAIATACGPSEAQRQADEAQKQAAKDAGQSAQPTMADPVSFKDLQTVFAPLDGWEMGKPTGISKNTPVPFSQAEVTYRKGDASIEATITDSGFNQMLIAPISMYLTAGFERGTANGYEKSTTLGTNPGWEKWDSNRKRGELAAFVNKRFIVNFVGRHVDDTKVLYQLAGSSDLNRLTSLK